jgi:hypothetical protein
MKPLILFLLLMIGPGVSPGSAADAIGRMTFDLVDRNANGVADPGDRLALRYTAGAVVPDAPVEVRFQTTANQMPHSFDGEDFVLLRDDGTGGDETAGDGVFSLDLLLGADAPEYVCLQPKKDGAILATVTGGGAQAASSFPFNLRTGRSLGFTSDYAIRPESVYNRLLWLRETRGENLALGKPVRFSLEPEYAETKAGETDTTDLTDGKLAGRADDKIWFDSATVGWYEASRPTQGVNILIDLGSVQPVGKVVARFLAGAEQGGLVSPAEFTVVVSEDGKTFHSVANLLKLMPAESNRAGEPGNYYLEEAGVAFTHPFVFTVKVRARYIGLTVKGATDCLFSDEIAVIKGDFPAEQATALSPERAVPFVTEGVIFGPRKPILAVSTNVLTPNFFRVLDCRPSDRRPLEARCVIELPAAVTILPSEASREIEVEEFVDETGAARKRWRFPMPPKEQAYKELYRQPFYLTVDGIVPVAAQAVFYVESPGFEPNRNSIPIQLIDIPAVPELTGFHVSLAWMTERYAPDWPGFFDAWRHLGFDTVSIFPYWWKNSDAQPYMARTMDWLGEARKRGFKVLQNDSPFHMMVNRHGKEPEIYSQLPAGPSKNLCPAYRGEFYQDEIRRVGELFDQCDPDSVFYDIEIWRSGAMEAPRCSRCVEWQKKSGKPMAECLVDMGTGMLKDLHDEIARRAAARKRSMPVLAMYDLRACEESYQHVHSFLRAYPRLLQWSQPSLYCLNRIGYAHESMKAEFKALGGKKGVIVPWITAGTYGEADSSTVEALVLECFLNGAAGITYFQFVDFDSALDFQAHAQALAALAPHQELLRSGTACEVPVASKGVLSSAWWNEKDEMLLLLGNYDQRQDAWASVRLPFAEIESVTDARSGQALEAANPLSIRISGNGFTLLHIRGKPVSTELRSWWSRRFWKSGEDAKK